MKLLLIIILAISVGCETKSEIKITADDNTQQPANPNGSGGESSGGESGGGESSGGDSSGGESSGGDSSGGDSGGGESSGGNNAILSGTDFSDPDLSNTNLHNFVAFSVRKVVAEYSGPFFRAIRDDGVEADFGAGVDTIDTVALQAWIDAGGGNAYITKWYDQSGNLDHGNQTDSSKRPQLIADCSNGGDPHPCFYFNNFYKYLEFNEASTDYGIGMNKGPNNANGTGMALFLNIKFNSAGDQLIIGDFGNGNYEVIHYGSLYYAYNKTFSIVKNMNDFAVYTLLEDTSNNGYFYYNGSFVAVSNGNMWDATNGYADTSKFGVLGGFSTDSRRTVNYYVTELILINTAISREDTSENKNGEIATDITNFYGL